MNSAFVFAIAIFMLAVVVSVVRLGGLANAIQYLRKSDNRMILKGIIAFIGAGVVVGMLFGLFGCSQARADEPEAEWFKYGELYLGVDWPVLNGHTSPQCVANGPDNKTTSNGGLRANIVSYGRFEFNAKYQHHSCAFNQDQNLVDHVGVETTFKLW